MTIFTSKRPPCPERPRRLAVPILTAVEHSSQNKRACRNLGVRIHRKASRANPIAAAFASRADARKASRWFAMLKRRTFPCRAQFASA